jgi:hypothetical protein
VRRPESDSYSLSREAEILNDALARHEAGGVALPHRHDQLCHQALEALAQTLAASRDAVLRELVCLSVVPGRGSSLVVTVEVDDGVDPWMVRRKLVTASGYLREELASSIHRKRTPELTFEVLPRGSRKQGEP